MKNYKKNLKITEQFIGGVVVNNFSNLILTSLLPSPILFTLLSTFKS